MSHHKSSTGSHASIDDKYWYVVWQKTSSAALFIAFNLGEWQDRGLHEGHSALSRLHFLRAFEYLKARESIIPENDTSPGHTVKGDVEQAARFSNASPSLREKLASEDQGHESVELGGTHHLFPPLPKFPMAWRWVCVCHLGSPELLLPWSLDEDAGSAGTLMINCTVLRVNLTQNMTKQSRWSGSIHSHLNWARSVDLGPAIGLRLGGVYVYETNSISMCIILILHSAVRQVWPLGKQKARNSGQALSLSLSRWVYINWPTGSLYRCWEVH